MAMYEYCMNKELHMNPTLIGPAKLNSAISCKRLLLDVFVVIDRSHLPIHGPNRDTIQLLLQTIIVSLGDGLSTDHIQ